MNAHAASVLETLSRKIAYKHVCIRHLDGELCRGGNIKNKKKLKWFIQVLEVLFWARRDEVK